MGNNYGIYDFTWIRGTTTPLIAKFEQNGVPLEFDDVRLSVYSKNAENVDTLLFRLSLADNPGTGPGTVQRDIVTGVVTFHPTAAMTRLLTQSKIGTEPAKGKNRYEVELRNGADEDIYLLGTIAGIGGMNDDEVTP